MFIFGIPIITALLMFALGAVHSGVDAVPALGFWPCFGILVLAVLVRSVVAPVRKK